MRRRDFITTSAVAGLALSSPALALSAEDTARKLNIVYIFADDLGYRELGCYGQEKILTPNIDKLCAQGMKFTRHYSGAAVCAPARCVLMTGKHTGQAYIRGNRAHQPEGQLPIPADTVTIPKLLKKMGYATGAFGKWGLGYPGSEGDPLNQGFDRFFGFNCQRHAHSFFPSYLWDNDRHYRLYNFPPVPGRASLPDDLDPDDWRSYEIYRGQDYSSDHINREALRFIKDNRDRPFFLYYPTQLPHVALHVPDDEILHYYQGLGWEDPPSHGFYTPCWNPRATYAAMITRLDRYVGKLVDELDKHGLTENTVVIFDSDNGATFLGPMAEFFDSVGELRGLKGQLYEGGLRVPMIVKWPGVVSPGSVSDRVTGGEDWMPTMLEMTEGQELVPEDINGISFVPTLRGETQEEREFLYRETPESGAQQAVWMGRWKGIRTDLRRADNVEIELYDLHSDPSESNDLAERHPEVVARIEEIMMRERVPSEHFRIPYLDNQQI